MCALVRMHGFAVVGLWVCGFVGSCLFVSLCAWWLFLLRVSLLADARCLSCKARVMTFEFPADSEPGGEINTFRPKLLFV